MDMKGLSEQGGVAAAAEYSVFSQTPSGGYVGSYASTFNYFMYDVFGYGIGLGTYIYTSRAWVTAFCVWLWPLFIGLWMNIRFGLQIAFPISAIPFLLAMTGRIGNFWEIFSVVYLATFTVNAAGRPAGIAEGSMGAFSNAGLDENGINGLCGPVSTGNPYPYCSTGTVDGSVTLYTVAVISVVLSSILLAYEAVSTFMVIYNFDKRNMALICRRGIRSTSIVPFIPKSKTRL